MVENEAVAKRAAESEDSRQPQRRVDALEIQRQLLARICLSVYRPGDQLKETELAREFGVSRTPVRDALSRIDHLGLIESRNGVGTVVVELSPAQIREVYDVRLALAELIGKLSPVRPSSQHLAALRDMLARARSMQLDFAAYDYVVINHELNELIASMIGNAVLRDMWLQTYVQAASTWHRVAETLGAEVVGTLIAELSDLITAVERGNAEAVGYLQRLHIGYGYQKVKEVFDL